VFVLVFDGLRKKRRPGLLFRGVADLREDSVLLSRRLGVYLWSESFLPMFSQSIILCFDTFVLESCRFEAELLCLRGRL